MDMAAYNTVSTTPEAVIPPMVCTLKGGDACNEAATAPRHGELVVSMCVSGESMVCIHGREHVINTGVMAVKLPGVQYHIDHMSADFESLEFRIPGDFIKESVYEIKSMVADLALMAETSVYRLDPDRRDDFVSWVRQGEKVLATMGDYRKKYLQNLILSVIYFVCDVTNGEGNGREKQMRMLCGNDRRYHYFVTFLDLLGKNCACERSVSFYADKLFITPKYLSSVIKDVSGRTAGEWIDEFVMIEARAILQKTDCNISEAAYKLNFPSTSFFGKYFKRHTGMSPSDFKRKYTVA